MLHLLDPKKLLPAYALVTATISVFIFVAIQHYFAFNWEVYKVVTLSSTVSSVLVVILFSTPAPRWMWHFARWLSKEVYPDLTGTWEGTISPAAVSHQAVAKPMAVRARIQHSLLTLFIDFHGETFDSITLSATPLVEKGQHHLHYVYQSDSKIPGREAYRGTTILRVREVETEQGRTLALSGHYFTMRCTIGSIQLHRTSKDTTRDVVFIHAVAAAPK